MSLCWTSKSWCVLEAKVGRWFRNSTRTIPEIINPLLKRMCRMHYARFWSSFPAWLCVAAAVALRVTAGAVAITVAWGVGGEVGAAVAAGAEMREGRPLDQILVRFWCFKVSKHWIWWHIHITRSTRYNKCRNLSINRTSRGPCKYMYIIHIALILILILILTPYPHSLHCTNYILIISSSYASSPHHTHHPLTILIISSSYSEHSSYASYSSYSSS